MNTDKAGLMVAWALTASALGLMTCNGLGAFAQPTPAVMTTEELRKVQLCLSEASTRRTGDCPAIEYIIEQRAADRGITVPEYIRRYHRRHTVSASRPWIGQLTVSLDKPASWPTSLDWDGPYGRPGILRVLETIRASNSHGCSEPPADWGGREVDCDNLQDRLDGGWHEVTCTGGSLNMFLARGHRDPVPDLQCEEVRARLEQRRMDAYLRRHGITPRAPGAATPADGAAAPDAGPSVAP